MPWSEDPDERATTIEAIAPGSVLDRAIAIYRAHFVEVYAVALIIGLIEAIVTYAAADSAGAALLALLVVLLTSTVLTGIVVTLVRDVQAGVEDPSVGSLLREVLPALGPLLGVSLLAGLGTGVGLVLLIVPGLILLTIWAVVGPIVVIERSGVMDAFGRSRALVRGNGWRVFGLLLLSLLLVSIASFVAAAVTAGLGDVLGQFVRVLLVALVSPIQALVTGVLYFRLRDVHGEPPVGREPAGPAAPRDPDPFGR